MNYLRSATADNPQMLMKLASFYDSVHSPARALSALGLQNHPSTAHIAHYRDPMHMKIVYHADPRTMYQREQSWPDVAPPRPPDNPLLPLPRPDMSDGSGSGQPAVLGPPGSGLGGAGGASDGAGGGGGGAASAAPSAEAPAPAASADPGSQASCSSSQVGRRVSAGWTACVWLRCGGSAATAS